MVMFTATVISQVLLLTKTFTPMMAASLEIRTKLKEGRDLQPTTEEVSFILVDKNPSTLNGLTPLLHSTKCLEIVFDIQSSHKAVRMIFLSLSRVTTALQSVQS